MQTTTVTLPKASCLKMIELVTEIEGYYFNGVEHSRAALVQAVTEWPGTEFDYHIEENSIIVASFQVIDVYRNERNDGSADWLEIQYEVPGDTIPTSTPMYFKQILPLAVELQLIDDFTFDYDVEVICNIEQGGYISARTGEWCEMPDIRRRMDWNTFLRNLDYQELEWIASLFIKKNIAR